MKLQCGWRNSSFLGEVQWGWQTGFCAQGHHNMETLSTLHPSQSVSNAELWCLLCFYNEQAEQFVGLLMIWDAYHWCGSSIVSGCWHHGPLTRLRVTHAPGMPRTFSPPLWISDFDMYHGTCITHVPWCMPGSLTSSFLWSRLRGKHSQHSQRMRNPQFYISGKRPMERAYCPHSH